MSRQIVPNDPRDPLRIAWADHLGYAPDDEHVYGWPDDFENFKAGWDAARATTVTVPIIGTLDASTRIPQP